MALTHTPQITDPDGFYEELVNAQRDMSDAEAQKMLAKLVLLLANHVGDRLVLSEAIAQAARRGRSADPVSARGASGPEAAAEGVRQ